MSTEELVTPGMMPYKIPKDRKGCQVTVYSCFLESTLAANPKLLPVFYDRRGKSRLKIRGTALDLKIVGSITTRAKLTLHLSN